jgi:hypothetical protein
MTKRIERFADEIVACYRDIVIGDGSRIGRGVALWNQFEAAVEAYRANDDSRRRQLTECVNELVVAKWLVEDEDLIGPIRYEPDLLPDGRRIDFVVSRGDDNLYVEVKTVHPQTADTQRAWDRYVRLRELHPQNVDFHFEQEWMGGALYGNTYASRSHFLEYTLEFEDRLAAAKAIGEGPGVLVFCGDGWAWHLSDLEDFADFYHAGTHRQDDPFALMEQHHIDDRGIQILRNVGHFACVRRAITQTEPKQFVFPVRGPRFGAPIVTSNLGSL